MLALSGSNAGEMHIIDLSSPQYPQWDSIVVNGTNNFTMNLANHLMSKSKRFERYLRLSHMHQMVVFKNKHIQIVNPIAARKLAKYT